jgi:DNA (cytosine-5)-methyltransferase 1
MRYLSVCSGIEAATVAWHPLGWEPVGFAEIDKFPSAVLAHHYPDVPNFGDFTTIMADDVGTIDLLVGGTPCQDFSIAGLRAGMAGDRGNLTLEFLRLAERLRPRWLVWENVPGVLSSNGGRDFGAFLGGLVERRYGFAYRVLDAQYFGLAQRRKRVFVVAYLGDWRRAAAVLFEREGLSWNPPPRGKAGKDVAGTLSNRASAGGGLGTDFDLDGGLIAKTLLGKSNGSHAEDLETYVSHSLNAKGGSGRIDAESETFVTHALRAEGFDASEGGTGRGTPLVPVPIQSVQAVRDKRQNGIGIGEGGDAMFTLTGRDRHAVAFSCKDHGADAGDIAPTLRAMEHSGSHANAGGQVAIAYRTTGNDGCYELGDLAGCLNTGTDPSAQIVAFDTTQITSKTNRCNPQSGDACHPLASAAHAPAVAISLRGREGGATAEIGGETMPALRTGGGGGDKPHTLSGSAVRRLTPRECERLQGFPDDYTLITYRGKPAADGPRYRALGNSMAVPVMRWIGQRIAASSSAQLKSASSRDEVSAASQTVGLTHKNPEASA